MIWRISRRNSIIKWQGYRVSASRLAESNFRYTQSPIAFQLRLPSAAQAHPPQSAAESVLRLPDETPNLALHRSRPTRLGVVFGGDRVLSANRGDSSPQSDK